MDIKVQAKAAEHIFHIVSKKPFTPPVEFIPQKIGLEKKSSASPLPRKSPESVGVSSVMLAEFLKCLEKNSVCNVHQVTVIKDGAIISECGFAPFKRDMWHVTHSMCKTVTAMAIGILVTDGKLDIEEKLVKIFEKYCSPITKMKLGKITVRHLLTMSSGIILNEGVIAAEQDWLKAYLESACRFEPGTKFLYNSINSYVLSCIVQELTGVTMFDFLCEKLFKPLGIVNVQWESCPMGRTKGGWGMYIAPEDMGKLGLFLLNKGKNGEKQIISPEYVNEMTKKQIDTADDDTSYGYGYQVWMSKREGSFVFNGMLGQNIHCMPDLNMVVAVTGGNNKLFENCLTNDIIYKYLSDNFTCGKALPESAVNLHKLRLTEASLINKNYYIDSPGKIKAALNRFYKTSDLLSVRELNGKKYKLDSDYVRLQPLFAQLLNNSYSAGISEIGFVVKDNRFCLTITEGDRKNTIPIGFDSFVTSVIDINGEPYIVAVKGKFSSDEDDVPVLKISMPFLEHSNGRIIKIFFLPEGRIKTEWLEIPGKEILSSGTEALLAGMSDIVVNEIKSKVDIDLIFTLADTVMEPVVYGKIMDER